MPSRAQRHDQVPRSLAGLSTMFRPASLDDVTAILAIEVKCFGTGAWGAPTIESSIASAHEDVVIATSGQAYGVVRMGGDVADLDRIAVTAPVRRQGVARGLLDRLIAGAVERGAEQMMLEVAQDNAAALALYEAAGFQQIHRRKGYYPGGVDALVLQLPLTH